MRIDTNTSDSQLITMLKEATETERNEILMTLYERYKHLVLKVCFQYLSNYDLAQDVFHDVFIKVIHKAKSLKNPAVFKSWLLIITKNLCIDRLRSNSLSNIHDADSGKKDSVSDQRPEDYYVAKIEKDRILTHLSSCFQKLDQSLMMILKLRWRGLKASEISKMIGMNQSQLRQSYRRIRLILESHMEERGIKIKMHEIITLAENHGTF